MNIFEIRNVIYANLLRYNYIDIKQGRITFIKGESGSGKSSLLRLLNYSRNYDSGEISYLNKSLADYDPLLLRREVSLVAQEVFLIDGTIYDNFKFFYEARELAVPSESHMQKFLELACISVTLDKSTQTLSGGEKQRVYLAVFMSFEPQVLILDEPTAALDEDTGRHVMANIVQYVKERDMSLIVVSHSQALTDAYAEDIIYIKKEAVGHA